MGAVERTRRLFATDQRRLSADRDPQILGERDVDMATTPTVSGRASSSANDSGVVADRFRHVTCVRKKRIIHEPAMPQSTIATMTNALAPPSRNTTAADAPIDVHMPTSAAAFAARGMRTVGSRYLL